MLSVSEALDAILKEVHRGAAVHVPLAEALGLVLAEDVLSDLDSPPFDKALMDGYAVRAPDITEGATTLTVIEEVTAGQVPQRALGPGEAIQIMTGAPIPGGSDAVIRVEETSTAADNQVTITSGPVSAGRNIMYRGTAMKRGDHVLSVGSLLRPQEIGALAELGVDPVPVFVRPRVAVLATGDELVAVHETPGPGQIRNSNEMMLCAQAAQAGASVVPLGIAADERSELRERILAGLDCDVLLLSGGVSAGKLDLVPSELEGLGVGRVFHKVHLKPGKPLWFGVFDRGDKDASPVNHACYVFGLPGNPVSSMVCFDLFVRAAIRRLRGLEPAMRPPERARLTEEFRSKGGRPVYHPAVLENSDSGRTVRPVLWRGSADVISTVTANGLVHFPGDQMIYTAGTTLDVYPW